MTAARASAPAGRIVPPLMRDTVFRRFWTASTVSLLGDQVSSIAVPLTAVLALHAGAAAMGYLTALEWLPSLLLGMHAGTWLGRRGRRRETMIACDLGRCCLLATIPACWALHLLTLWQLYAVVLVVARCPSCSTWPTARCSSPSSGRRSTWTASHCSTAAGRCRLWAGHP